MKHAISSEQAGTELLQFPCSSSQQRCWFIDALDPGTAALNVALRWELTGSVSDEVIERAFNTIIRRHEILRTRFVVVDGVPTQEVLPELRLKLSVIELRSLPNEAREAEARRLAECEAHVPFDIRELPLIRVTVLRLADERVHILLTVHQIAFDGWSIRVIAREFGEIATALAEGQAPGLAELPLQYGDYSLWQKEYLAAEAPRHERYWYDQLAHAPYLEVPSDFGKPPRPTHCGIILAEMLSPDLGDRMEEAARQFGVTPFALGCAATVALLKLLTGRSDIVLGTQIAGRDEAELEDMIGVFINNLVLRVDTRHTRSFTDLLARTRDTVREALIHQAMPFHRLVELLNPPRDPARTPLISVNFTMLKEVLDAGRYGSFRLEGLPSVAAGSLYDLNFFVVKWPDGWRMAMEYNPDLFREETARTFLALWRNILERAIREPDFALDGLVAPARDVAPAPATSQSLRVVAPVRDAECYANPTTVAALAEIWREVLGTGPLTAEADFFALGGHSLLAIRMLLRIHDKFGERIDPLTLFETSTLGGLALHLDGRMGAAKAAPAAPEPWSVVPIQPLGDAIAIIAINNTLAYRNVAHAIGTDRPFFGVQLFDPNSPRELAERRLEDIARDYVALIRTVRPSGPYILAGLCVAGAIAYEAARQLEAAGEEVPLVILADTWRPGYLADLPPRPRAAFWRAYRWHVLKHHYAELAAGRTRLADVLASYPVIRRTGLLKIAARLGLIEKRAYNRQDWSNRWFLPMVERARNAYRPGSFGGQVVLLRSDEIVTAGLGEDLGWAPLLAKPPRSHAVPGWHVDMFQNAGAQAIAEHLRPLLQEVSLPAPRQRRHAAE